jgi:flagellar basal-body rod protein FlgG
MERALWSAVTGMRAQELSMDTIANNLANINTTGFKTSHISFQDMLYSSLRTPGADSGEGQLPVGIQVGHGTRVAGVARMFQQGALINSGGDFDLAIEGDGFFEVVMPDGDSAYTRDGAFKINGSGEVVTLDGYRVAGFDSIDPGTTDVTIAPDGSFSTVVNGVSSNKSRLTLVRFINPAGLRSVGKNLYKATEASGNPQTGQNPGENGVGFLAHRQLESSNVNAAEQLVNMITSQRAYEAASKAIKASDEMMGQANNLR